ncbi:UNVERIFIED_CONTAM: hypothetical protein H355_003184 [Colinus virginianus]|nr:hypothetical protein H355_003184 [Colinus virginianus]
MRRRKTAVAAACCLALLLGTLLNPPEEEGGGGGGGRAALARQLRERYEEQQQQQQPRGRAAAERGRASAELGLEPPLLGCRELRAAGGVQYLGSGYTKAVYKAVLNRSLAVALKAVDFGGHDVARCVRQFAALADCYRLAAYKIVKEMVLLQRLRHANVLQLYGYCYQDSNDIPDTLTAITELGSPLEMIQLLQTSWEDRFRFVIVDGELKVTDLDDASIEESSCTSNSDCFMEFPARNFTLPCSVEGRCQNMNEKRNLYNAYRYAVGSLKGELHWGIDETAAQLERVLNLYKSGEYLQNTTRISKSEYRRVPEAFIPDENYRCWPSYHHKGCLLSVFDLSEAMEICDSYSQCKAFILTNQTTWTGRQLVFFKAASNRIVPDPDKITYVKVTD